MIDYFIKYHVLASKINMAMIDIEASMQHMHDMMVLWREDHGANMPNDRVDGLIKAEIELIKQKIGIK